MGELMPGVQALLRAPQPGPIAGITGVVAGHSGRCRFPGASAHSLALCVLMELPCQSWRPASRPLLAGRARVCL